MRYILYVIFLLLLQLVAWLLTPLIACFWEMRLGWCDNRSYPAEGPRLRKWLAWFDTPDNSLSGDANWQAAGHDGTRWLDRCAWLYRNSLYGLKWGPLAYQVTNPAQITYQGDPRVNRNNGVTGLFRASTPDGRWQWKLVKKLVGDYGVMLNFGWQLDEFVKSGVPGTALLQFSPRPVRIR